ncbi:MAG: sulfite exporter TauE/SafE family protein [Anaerolineae bacterium]
MPEQWIELIIVGLVAGVAAGMFGIGGGAIIVPALTLLLGFSIHEANGTSLAALLPPVSLFAVMAYYRAGTIRISTAVWIAVGIVFGGILGANVALGLPQRDLRHLYGLFLIYMGWRYAEPRIWLAEWRGQKKAAPEAARTVYSQWYALTTLGVVAGVLAGLFGIGGGVIIVAALVEFFHFDHKQAVGTSLAALLPPVAFGAVIEYYNEGQLNIAVAALVAVGLVIGSIAGARLALRMPSRTVKRLYGVFLFLVSLRFLLT